MLVPVKPFMSILIFETQFKYPFGISSITPPSPKVVAGMVKVVTLSGGAKIVMTALLGISIAGVTPCKKGAVKINVFTENKPWSVLSRVVRPSEVLFTFMPSVVKIKKLLALKMDDVVQPRRAEQSWVQFALINEMSENVGSSHGASRGSHGAQTTNLWKPFR